MSVTGVKSIALFVVMMLLTACSNAPDRGAANFIVAPPSVDQIEESVTSQVALMVNAFAPVAGQALPNETIQEAYEYRNFKPIWIEDKKLNLSIYKLVDILEQASSHGLNPIHYHTQVIKEYLNLKSPSRQQLAELDVIATVALSSFAHDLSIGRYEPQLIDPNWQLDAPSNEWSELLFLESSVDMVNYLPSLAPRHPHYQVLQKWLVYYQDLASKEKDIVVDEGPTLSIGRQGERVAQLRARLVQLGDIRFSTRTVQEDKFDRKLKDALINFQRRHNLYPDGRAGAQTIERLNVPMSVRAKQIAYNLERWRWLPTQLEAERIWVDLTDYKVHTILNGKHTSMKIIIGDQDHKTPVFKGDMSYMVTNPTWRVPHRIAQETLLPILYERPNYLIEQGYKVLSNWTIGAKQLDPTKINWKAIEPEDLTYRFEQDPDENNALGQYKFMFPNKNEIYLHDTPNKRLFRKANRAFSSGCIRLEDAAGFAASLVAGTNKNKALQNAIKKTDTKVISLPKRLPVYLVYFTAQADVNGMPEFREDVYERDILMSEAMDYKASNNAPF
ncbi:murein L,D-transpeptidase [Marinomonas agarivorans]|nr:murein L,D-transpeptidase [Marinomonas agarivorans]